MLQLQSDLKRRIGKWFHRVLMGFLSVQALRQIQRCNLWQLRGWSYDPRSWHAEPRRA